MCANPRRFVRGMAHAHASIMKSFAFACSAVVLFAPIGSACSINSETVDDSANRLDAAKHESSEPDGGGRGGDGGGDGGDASPATDAAAVDAHRAVDAANDGANDCLAACRSLIPSGPSASALILYSCGTTCGTAGECGTQNLFGSSAACSTCMVDSQNGSCTAARAQCNTDKVCADFLACVTKCL